MSVSRRHFVQGSATALLANAVVPRLVPTRLLACRIPKTLVERVDSETMKQLALRAVDASRAAGATYADVRLTRTVRQTGSPVRNIETLAVGVRCLVREHWGFAASPVWSSENVIGVARRSAAIARGMGTASDSRVADWTPIPIASGDWTMPVEIDPFAISVEEKIDCCDAFRASVSQVRLRNGTLGLTGDTFDCTRQERAVATTEGAYFTQTVYRTSVLGNLRFFREDGLYFDAPFQYRSPGGRGWELLRDAHLFDQIPALSEQLEEVAHLPVKEIVPGRYDVVVDGWAMAESMSHALLQAREGSPALTLIADRSMPGGLATVRWDDEGVMPATTVLIQAGTRLDYQATRDQKRRLTPGPGEAGQSPSSRGFAASTSALDMIMPQIPNLSLAAGSDDTSLTTMIAQVKKGILCFWGDTASIAPRARNWTFQGAYYREILNGRLGALIRGRLLVNAVNPWNNLAAVGGLAEGVTQDFPLSNGTVQQHQQEATYSVRAVPGLFKDILLS